VSIQYATPSDLASYLKQDIDTSTATLALQVASQLFVDAAHTRWESNSTTYSQPGTNAYQIVLPNIPVIAVSAVRIAGVTVTDYTVIAGSVYRRLAFGNWWRFPPDLVEVDYTYGYTSVPDDVKGAVLETAGAAYMSPDITVASEQIDDYVVKSALRTGGFQLSEAAAALAAYYAGVLVA
jgi:hypothetical protein